MSSFTNTAVVVLSNDDTTVDATTSATGRTTQVVVRVGAVSLIFNSPAALDEWLTHCAAALAAARVKEAAAANLSLDLVTA